MKVAIKILDSRLVDLAGSSLPAYETAHAAGMDIRACIDTDLIIPPGGCALVPAGFAMAVPEGFVAVLAPRSGLGHKHGIVLGNLVGVLDADYRGQVMVSVWNRREPRFSSDEDGNDLHSYRVQPLERIAQMLILPVARAEWDVVAELPESGRGAGGFGSTG